VAILTLAEYKEWAGITGTGDDSRLQTLIDYAHVAMRRYCGRSLTDGFESATRTETYEVDASELVLKEWPITSITSITPILADNTAGTALDSTTYHVDLSTGVVSLNAGQNGRAFTDDATSGVTMSDWAWRPNFGRCTVVYVSAAPPDDIEMALCRMVDGLYASVRSPGGVASQSLGQWSVSYTSPTEAAAGQATLLAPYRSGAGL